MPAASFSFLMLIGGGEASVVGKIAFFGSSLAANAMISAEDFLLATSAAMLITVAIGFFWSSGRTCLGVTSQSW